MSNVPYLSFFLLFLLLDFLVLIFPFSFGGLMSNIFSFSFFLTCCLFFNIWPSSFLRSSWLGCRMFFWVFLSLESSSLFSVVSFFDRGSIVVFFFLFFFFYFLFLFFWGWSSGFCSSSSILFLSNLKQQTPKIDFHHSKAFLIV